MKSYTLANWDGGLTNGNTSANTSAKTSETADVRKTIAIINGRSQTGAPNTNGHIPTGDTRHSSGGSRGRREMNDTGKSSLNGLQHANVFYTGSDLSTRSTVNGCATLTKNGTQSNPPFIKFNNKPSFGHRNALSVHREDSFKDGAILARASSSRVQVFSQRGTHVQRTTATTSQNPSDVRDTADGQMVLAMDVDDSSSSADAEGEEVDEDSDDALLIKDMLLEHEPSSPTCPSDSLEDDRQLSPLFTPVASPQDNNRRKPVESPFIPWPASPVPRTRDIAPFSTTVQSPPLPSSSPSLAEGIFSLPITTINPQKRRIEVAKPRGRKRKRMVLSHIEIPPFPLTCPRESYFPSSSSMAAYSPILLPRPAKQLAHLKVQKTMAETRRIASEINLDVEQFDDGRDSTYKPSSYTVKKKNATPGPSRTSVVPCSVSPSPPVAASWQAFAKEPSPPTTTETSTTSDHPMPVSKDTAIVYTKEPSPPNDPESNPTSNRPTPVPELTPAAVPSHLTPAKPSTQEPSFGLDSSPLSSLPSSQISPLSLPPLPKAEEKRKYKKRLRDEGRETESDNPKLKKKSKTARGSRSKNKKRIVQHTPAEGKKGRQMMMLPGSCRYDRDRDILRFFVRGIPPTQHCVLAMNTRHVRQCKDVHQDQSYFVDVAVTKRTGAVARTFLAFPPPSSAAVGDGDQYYLGGVVQELVEIEHEQEDVVQASLPPKRSKEEEECPASQAVVQDAPSTVPSVSGSSSLSPQHFGQDQDQAGYVHLETENILDQFLTGFCPSPHSASHQRQSSGSNNLEPLSGDHLTSHRSRDDGYDSGTLSRALVSVDCDPFLSGASYFLESSTADSWPKRAELSEDKHSNEPSVVNDTIDPSVLRGEDFEEPSAIQDYRLQEDPITYSASRPLSPQTVDGSQSQQPYSELVMPSVDEDPFLSSPSGSPLPLSAHRPVVTPRRLLDMVDIRDLDLPSVSSESDNDQAGENDDPAYTASSSKLEAGTPRRKGPRIVSAKELARIQRQKALEREEQQKRLMATLKASLPPAPATKPKKSGRSFKIRAPPTTTKWECGPDYTTCHHCRGRSYRLKMTCKCGRPWCNRCIITKYDQPFDANMRGWVCPCCQNACRCDLCTKKRGETYISTRTWGPLSKIKTKDAKDVQATRSKRDEPKRNPFLSEEEGDFDLANDTDEDEKSEDEPTAPVPQTSKRQITLRAEKPFPPTEIVGTPGSHWAAVYSLTGERVTTAIVGEGNRTVTVSCSVEALLLTAGISRRKKRLFIGRVQPCWGHDIVHKSKVRQLQEGSEDVTVKRLIRDGGEKKKNPRFEKRVYIGNPEVFLELGKRNKKEKGKHRADHDVVVPDEDSTNLRFSAYSLSPLSSLSSLPESETEDKEETESPEDAGVMAKDGEYESGANLGANPASSGLYGDIVADKNGHGQERDCLDIDASGNDHAVDEREGYRSRGQRLGRRLGIRLRPR
ncbi:hypothetical protein M378DRAFT_162173 [Amanita muscaria Koide BX008]|uniref:Zinc-finger domain-containing protein n=1 Tax=Amanita muscaria (strain Koide BX008) TaxID=946122 RepID=A0A0C2TEH2_AMAMK|nr:hypothetical protein M378DRAFT_162173 [Amanita muscaria Koide BX008]